MTSFPHDFPLSRQALADAMTDGARPEFLAFPDWGGAEPLGWLAPWTPTPFVHEGFTFASAEHFLMHGKALLFGDHETADRIRRARLPFQARELGRKVRDFREDAWIAGRERIIVEANRAKFLALPEPRDFLLSTWPKILVQSSALDKVWSSGLDLEDPWLTQPSHWPGLNLVGFSLMRAREELRAGASSHLQKL